MARGVSVHIGLNRVDPASYEGWDGALNACEADAHDMDALARSCGFDASVVLTSDATADAIIGQIRRIAGELADGDIFLLTYSGHGGQVPDRNGDEPDRTDETWVAYDREIVDDELYALWAQFAAGVRIFVLSDSCHSGSVTKAIESQDVPDVVATRATAAAQSPRYKALPRDVMIATYRAHRELYDGIQDRLPNSKEVDPAASVLLISGCRDDQLSADGFSNGLFTENLLAVWDGGQWQGDYAQFHEAIRSRMPDDQQPELMLVGAANRTFEQQRPFTVA